MFDEFFFTQFRTLISSYRIILMRLELLIGENLSDDIMVNE